MDRSDILNQIRSWPQSELAQKRNARAERLYRFLLERQSDQPDALQTLATFNALNSEPDPELALRRFGLKIERRCLPQITDASKGLMRFVLDQGPHEKVLGVMQPSARAAQPVPLSEIRVILVPGVMFCQKTGGRIGRGKGFYDRILAEVPHALKIGVCFDVQLIEELELRGHDQKVDVVITETQILKWL